MKASIFKEGDWLILLPDGPEKCKVSAVVPYDPTDKDNHGLPAWAFEGEYGCFIQHKANGSVEFVPGCGPAPYWESPFPKHETYDEMLERFSAWCRETY